MKLDALIRKLDAIGPSLIETVKRRVAVECVRLISREFASSTDPYGVMWPGLKRPRPGGPVLVRTGVMRDSVIAYPTPDGVLFRVATPYAAFHQYGNNVLPVRRMLPATFLGLPPAWGAVIAAQYNATMRERLLA